MPNVWPSAEMFLVVKEILKRAMYYYFFFFWGQCLMARNMGVMKSGRKKKRVWTNENGKTLGKVRGKT